MDNNESLKDIIKIARELKKYSQRKLARECGISHTEIIRIESGERKKTDVDILVKMANILDISLVQLLQLSGYGNLIEIISLSEKDRFAGRSIHDLKNKIIEYEKSEINLIDDINFRRKIVDQENKKIGKIIDRIENPQFYHNNITIEEINEELKLITIELRKTVYKYSYDNVPKRSN